MRLENKISLLSNLPVFRLFEPAALRVLAFSAADRALKAGEELFRKGDAADCGFLVLSGRIAQSSSGAVGAGAQDAGPGTLIGETALFAATSRPATAVAVEPSAVMVLDRPLMHRVLEAHPDSASALRRHVASELAATEFALKSVLD